MTAMTCDNCGHQNFRREMVTRTFEVDGRVFLIRNVPAEVCDWCGDVTFTAEVAERLRRMMHDPGRTSRLVQAEEMEYQDA